MAFTAGSTYTATPPRYPSPPSSPYQARTTPSSPSLPYALSPLTPSAPPPPPPSSFILPSAPPPPSYNESQQQEDKAPPSGQWSGFFVENGAKNFFTMHLSFSHSSKAVGGQCTDETAIPGLPGGRVADILGTWEVLGPQQFQQAMIKFEKHYRGGDTINYEGYFTVGLKRVMGTHSNGSETFEMDFVEDPDKMVSAFSSESQLSAWVKPALISQYS